MSDSGRTLGDFGNSLEDTQAEEAGRNRMDAELRSIGAIIRLLEQMPGGLPARSRCMAYLAARYSQ
jgi:hypothetical protein